MDDVQLLSGLCVANIYIVIWMGLLNKYTIYEYLQAGQILNFVIQIYTTH